MSLQYVEHTIEPVFNSRSRVLLLGTMPSPQSRATGFYYGHPQNRFWGVLAAIFDEPVPVGIAARKDFLLRHGIALWDVLASCTIKGASDASITDARPNDLRRILETAPIQAVFATGTKAGQLYATLCEQVCEVSCTVLPSTSPANARCSFDQLVSSYAEALLPLLPRDEASSVFDVAHVVQLEQRIAQSGTSLFELMQRAGSFLGYETIKELSNAKETPHAAAKCARSTETNSSVKEARRDCAAKSNNLAKPNGRAAANMPRVVLLCGSGNNGGDGWVAAGYLAEHGCAVDIVTPKPAIELQAEPARTAALAQIEVPCFQQLARVYVSPSHETLSQLLAGAHVVVDAMLGTGFTGETVREPYAGWIEACNRVHAAGVPVVAADVPSGYSAQTGTAALPCIAASKTVTMIALKTGLALPGAASQCGTIRVAPLVDISDLQ